MCSEKGESLQEGVTERPRRQHHHGAEAERMLMFTLTRVDAERLRILPFKGFGMHGGQEAVA